MHIKYHSTRIKLQIKRKTRFVMKVTEFVFVSCSDSQWSMTRSKENTAVFFFINLTIYGNRKSCMAYQYHAGWWFSRQYYILLLPGTLTELVNVTPLHLNFQSRPIRFTDIDRLRVFHRIRFSNLSR